MNTPDTNSWQEQKQAERNNVYAMRDNAALGINSGEKLKEYLDIQSRFNHTYSVGNTLLIQAQLPSASRLKDFDGWNSAGTGILKGQQAISILEPGKPYKRDDGSRGTAYNVKKVFDISQTNAEPNAQPTVTHDARTLVGALIDKTPVTVRAVDELPEGVGAVYAPNIREIQVRRGMDGDEIFRCLSCELAHAELDKGDGTYDRSVTAFTAYCTAYALSKQYGVDTKTFRFNILPDVFSSGDPQAIRNQLTAISDTSKVIGGRIWKE